jgi:adenylate cyclase
MRARARVWWLVGVALASIGFALALSATGRLNALEDATIDERFAIRGTQRPPKNLVIIAIDNKTYQDLNAFPFPRTYYARLIDNLAAERPAAIVFDIDLANMSTIGKQNCDGGLPCDDLALLTAISNDPGITVFGSTQPNANGNGQVLFLGSPLGTRLLQEVGSLGSAVFPSNQPGGVYRQMIYSVQNVPTLYVAAAELAMHRHITAKQFGGDQWIDYPGAEHTIPWVSFSSVYDPKKYGPPDGWSHPLPPDYFRGKIVFVGETQLSLQDFHATSTDDQMAGVEIEADATATILNGFPLKSAPGWVNFVLIVLLAGAVPAGSVRLGPAATGVLLIVTGVVFAAAAQLAFDAGLVVTVVYPFVALIAASYGTLTHRLHYAGVDREHDRAHAALARFVPAAVADQLLAGTHNEPRLAAIELDGTVMFCDLRDFARFAENLSAARVIDVLNRYLTEMSEAILAYGGTLVAYMGDGIMGVFGAPLEQPDHADRALSATREILEHSNSACPVSTTGFAPSDSAKGSGLASA